MLDESTGADVVVSAWPIAGRKGFVAAFVDLTSMGSRLAALYGGGHPVEFLITSKNGKTVIARSIDSKRWVGASLEPTFLGQTGDGIERSDLTAHCGSTPQLGEVRKQIQILLVIFIRPSPIRDTSGNRDVNSLRFSVARTRLLTLSRWASVRGPNSPATMLSSDQRSDVIGPPIWWLTIPRSSSFCRSISARSLTWYFHMRRSTTVRVVSTSRRKTTYSTKGMTARLVKSRKSDTSTSMPTRYCAGEVPVGSSMGAVPERKVPH